MGNDIMVYIEKNRLKELEEASRILDALYAGGVADWEWYYQSLEDAGIGDNE